MTTEELKGLQVDKVIDARGTACPGPLLEVKRNIASVEVGQIIEVQSTDTGTTRDIPRWCKKMQHEYYGFYEDSGYFKILFKKSK